MIRGDLADVAAALRDIDDVVIGGHVSPDGDCIGSQLGMAWILKRLGKRVTCVHANADPIEYGLKSLPGVDEMMPAGEYDGPIGAFVTVDVPTAPRLGDGAELFARAPRTVTIDHHLAEEPLSQVNYVDSDAPACAMLVWKLLPLLGLEPDAEMATVCFAGTSTDTGSFCFQNATPEAFALASAMVSAGADAAAIARDVYQSRSMASLMLEHAMLGNMELMCDGRAAVSFITVDDMRDNGAIKADAEPLVDTLRSIRDVRVVCMLREQEDCVRGSFRAKDDTDVAAIARRLGGGGHRAAAGFTLKCSLAEARATVAAEIEGLF